MMEKQNDVAEKRAAGDAREIDDIVDTAVGKMDAGKTGRRAGYGIPPWESDKHAKA